MRASRVARPDVFVGMYAIRDLSSGRNWSTVPLIQSHLSGQLTPHLIGLKVGKVLGRYKVGKHFDCRIGEGSFQWSRRQDSIAQEAKLDGI